MTVIREWTLKRPMPAGAPHGTSAYRWYGCRCDVCRAGRTAQRAATRRRQAGQLDPDDPRHGSVATYQNWSCRCEKCRAAVADASRERRRREREARS